MMNFSFEFFPPKNTVLQQRLWDSIKKLVTLNPSFFSVTYGANCSTQNNTFNVVKSIQEQTKVNTAAHLTCVNLNVVELKKMAVNYWKNGIKSIVALRGDYSNNNQNKRNILYASDLVYLLKSVADFDITVAAYPEVHPEAKNAQSDLIYLKRKIDNGANRAITQFFFKIDKYLRFRDRCASIGIDVDVIPGILPILNYQQLLNFSKMTNVCIPNWIHKAFHNLSNDLDIQRIIGAYIAIK
ncbi:5,10-methylenetetrahydrofolate reductase, partial [Buchnera aphidicola (Hormaphis cornu)]